MCAYASSGQPDFGSVALLPLKRGYSRTDGPLRSRQTVTVGKRSTMEPNTPRLIYAAARFGKTDELKVNAQPRSLRYHFMDSHNDVAKQTFATAQSAFWTSDE